MAIVCILIIWAVVDGQQMFRPANVARKVVKPIVRPIIDEIRDRIIDPVTKKEVSGPSVIVVGRSWCEPCKRLMSEEMPKAKADGYTVIYDDKTAAGSYPTVRIWNGREWSTRSGFFKWVKPKSGPTQSEVIDYMRKNNGSAPPASWYPNGDPWRGLTAKEADEMFEGQCE